MSKNPLHMLWSWFCDKPEPVELKEELLPESKTDLSESVVPVEVVQDEIREEIVVQEEELVVKIVVESREEPKEEIVVESREEPKEEIVVETQEELVVEPVEVVQEQE